MDESCIFPGNGTLITTGAPAPSLLEAVEEEVASLFQSLMVISLLSLLRLPTTDDLTAAPTQLVISLILKTYETKTRGKKLVILFLDLQLTQNQRAMCVHRRVLETLDQI